MSSLLRSSTWHSSNYGILKSPREPCPLPGGCYGIDFPLRITWLSCKFKLTMICALSATASLSLLPTYFSLVTKFSLCGENSYPGWRKTEPSIVDQWIIFSNMHLLQEHRLLVEDGKSGGWQLQTQSGKLGMISFFRINPLISLNWQIPFFSFCGPGWRGGKRTSLSLLHSGPQQCL